MTAVFTQRYKTIKIPDGFRFCFYCDLCEHMVETPESCSNSYTGALEQAQTYAKLFFNRCHKCGKWVCDEHYNEDEMQCVICAPHKKRIHLKKTVPTAFVCPRCGHHNDNGDCFCKKCGKAL